MVPDITTLGPFIVASLALNISPGPNTIYVLSRGLEGGTKAGIIGTLGGSTGRLIHTLMTALGVSTLLIASPVAFNILKYAGVLYLVFLGGKMIYSAMRKNGTSAPIEKRREGSVFVGGLAINLFNPATAFLFATFLPHFVDP